MIEKGGKEKWPFDRLPPEAGRQGKPTRESSAPSLI